MLKIFQALVLLSFLTTFGCSPDTNKSDTNKSDSNKSDSNKSDSNKSDTNKSDSNQDGPKPLSVESSDTKTYEGEVRTGGNCKVEIPKNAEQLTNYGVFFSIYNYELMVVSTQEGQITEQSENNNTINFISTSPPFITLQYDKTEEDFTYFKFSGKMSPRNQKVFECYFN